METQVSGALRRLGSAMRESNSFSGSGFLGSGGFKFFRGFEAPAALRALKQREEEGRARFFVRTTSNLILILILPFCSIS